MVIHLPNGFKFRCGNGGNVRMVDDSDLEVFGVEDGWARWNDDFYLNAYSNLTLRVMGKYDITATIVHQTGDPVLSFNLTSLQPSGKTDVKVKNLKPDASYRLLFDGVLAESSTGRAHGKTNLDGTLQFNEVVIPNE